MNRRIPIPDMDELISLYNDKKFTILDMSGYYECSEGTVIGWFKIYGIDRRSGYRRKVNPDLLIKKCGDDVIHIDRSDINKSVCGILIDHARDLIDDPERLSTDFMKGLIGTSESCD